jgi:hypothetical protein
MLRVRVADPRGRGCGGSEWGTRIKGFSRMVGTRYPGHVIDVVSECAFRVSRLGWCLSTGQPALTVICKATYLLAPGESPLAPEQNAVNEEDRHWDDDPRQSLYAPSDLVPFKARPEVLLVGHAFALRGEPVRSLLVRLRVGSVDKALEMHADRAWTVERNLREGAPFSKMRLWYERAAASDENPVGMSFDEAPDGRGLWEVPNLQPAGVVMSRPEDRFGPIGFGPLSPSWPPRRARLRRYADTWRLGGWEERVLPADFDAMYFNAAPLDQQLDELHPAEWLTLEGLHPKHGWLFTRLSGARPRAMLERSGRADEEVRLRADTLWIDTDRGVCTLVWRGALSVMHALDARRVVVRMEGGQAPPMAMAMTETLGGGMGIGKALPFTTDRGFQPERRGEVGAVMASGASIDAATPSVATTTGEMSPAFPFRPAPDAWAAEPEPPTPPAPRAAMDDATGTVLGVRRMPQDILPFAPPIEPPPSRRPEPAAWTAPVPSLLAAPTLPIRELDVGLWTEGPPSVPVPPWVAPSLDGAAMAPRPLSIPWSAEVAPSAAIVASVEASSNAAAARERDARLAEGSESSRIRRVVKEAAPEATEAQEIVELLWFDPKALARIRTRWPDLIMELAFEALDPVHDLPTEEPEEARDRHDVFGVLTDGKAIDGSGIATAVRGAVNSKGRFTPPLVLVAGELSFPFDALETLKAVMAVVSPTGANDKRLKEWLDAAGEVLARPYLQGSTRAVEKLTQDLKEQAARASKGLTVENIEAVVERLLLEQRKYQRKKVFGEECIRALLGPAKGREAAVPVYLPRHLENALPMYASLRVRLLAEAHLRQDQYEGSKVALRVLGVGRVLQPDMLDAPSRASPIQ